MSKLPLAALALVAACHGTTSAIDGRATPDSAAIRRDVAHLASDALEGRATGTAGNDSAAAFIARRFRALGLQPIVRRDDPACRAAADCAPEYLQRFDARPGFHAVGGTMALATANVVALLPGRDPALRDEYVVIGAHHDHLGRGVMGALDAGAGAVIRNGADDNASGTAGVLELARLLARRPPARSVLFVTFSGEELGLLGSQYFVAHAPVPVDRMVAMLNFDMIGRLRDDKVIVYGVGTASELPALLQEANVPVGLRLSPVGDGFGPSDHSSFYAKQVPVLHFFTDLHDDYHRASDDTERLDAAGEARVIALAERVARAIADRPARLTYTRASAAARVTASRQGLETYLGSIPDMSASDVAGLRLTGVRPDSPADKAGLRGGDVVVEFDGKAVKDLYDYTNALYARQPGDTVRIVVLRGRERVTVQATLGRRGG
jgi:hypothetical protein